MSNESNGSVATLALAEALGCVVDEALGRAGERFNQGLDQHTHYCHQ